MAVFTIWKEKAEEKCVTQEVFHDGPGGPSFGEEEVCTPTGNMKAVSPSAA